MIKNLKYRLNCIRNDGRVRIGGLALFVTFTILAVTLLGCPIHTTEIFDGQKFYNLNSANRNFLVTDVNSKTSGTKVSDPIPVTYPVYVTCKKETVKIDFSHGTVADALVLAGFTPDKNDFVQPALDTEITKTTYINFAAVEYLSGKYTETVKYTTKIVYDSSKYKGYSKITKKGVNGKQEVSYTEKTVNGVSKGKNVVATKMLKEPVQAVKVVGTKKSPYRLSTEINDISTLKVPMTIKIDKNGNPINYKKKVTVRATAYTYTGNNCSTGVAPQPGYIAVNPKVIPYGTKMYIKSPDGKIIYGYAVAADTGGFIRNHPTGIDLFMTTEGACRNFGVRQMEIYILE